MKGAIMVSLRTKTKEEVIMVSVPTIRDIRYIDAPVVRFRDGSAGTAPDGNIDDTLYYCNDANMNVTALVDASNGNVVERCAYDAYGKVKFYNGNWENPSDTSGYENEILYCGYRHDDETKLFHVRNRMYHPTLGRWTVQDHWMRYADGMNLYEYVNSSPILRVDPLGLEVKKHGKPDKFMNCHGYTLGVILGNKQLAINRQLPGYSDVPEGGPTSAQYAKAFNSASFAAVLKWRGITYDQLLANEESAPGELKAIDYALHTAIIFEMFTDLKNEGCKQKAIQTSNTGGWYNDKPCTDDPDACDFVMMIKGHEFTVGGKKVKLFTAVHSAVRCKNGSWETVLGEGKEIITADQPDKLVDKSGKEGYYVYDCMVSWGCPKCKCKTDD